MYVETQYCDCCGKKNQDNTDKFRSIYIYDDDRNVQEKVDLCTGCYKLMAKMITFSIKATDGFKRKVNYDASNPLTFTANVVCEFNGGEEAVEEEAE